MKKDWIIPILTISIIIFCIWLNIYERTRAVIEIEKAIPIKNIEVQHFGKKQGTAIKYEFNKNKETAENLTIYNNVYFNNNILVTTEYETQEKTIARNPLKNSKTKTNYFNLYIYDISLNQSKLLKKIDVYTEMKQRYSEVNLQIVYRGVSKSDKTYYSIFGIFSPDNEKINSTILYDISKNKWVLDEDWTFNKYTQNTLPKEASIINQTNFSDVWFKNNQITTLNHNIIISSNSNDSIFNINLFDQYSDLDKFKQLYRNEHLGLYFTEETYNNGILNLLVPKGKNPYDGLILNTDASEDGQEHKIHSFEDYQKYSRYTNKDD